MLAWLRCLWRNRHSPVRLTYLPGFRCSECGLAGADLDAMGYRGGGYVRPWRVSFDRAHGEITRGEW